MLRFGNQVGNQNQQPLNEPDAEPVVDDSVDMDVDATHEMPSSSAGAPQHVPPADQVLTAENFVAWMLERCRRRMSQANDQNTEESSTSKEPTYSLDLGLLWFPPMLLFVIQQEGLWETCQTSVTMCGHPNYEQIHGPTSLGQAQRALAFINALQHGSEDHTGFSTNMDMVANALTRNATFPPHSPTSSSGEGETRSEAMERYMSSRRSSVSDPDLWNYLHVGDELSSESENEET